MLFVCRSLPTGRRDPLDPDAHPMEDALEEALSRVDLASGASRRDVKRLAETILGWQEGSLEKHDPFVRAFVGAKIAEMQEVETGQVSATAHVKPEGTPPPSHWGRLVGTCPG